MAMTLYVGNLPFSADQESVQDLFAAYGDVLSVKLMSDRETGRPRGFGFVEMEDDGARAAMAALDAACAGRGPIPLRCDGLGKFGRPHDATLWLGIAPHPDLVELAARVREELVARNVPFDGKAFKPHLTLARRVRIPRGALPALAFPEPAEARTVTLFKSTLTREGAVYKPLHSVELGMEDLGEGV